MNSIQQLLDWESAEHALIEALKQAPEKERLITLLSNEALVLVRNWYGQLMLLLPCTRSELERSACSQMVEGLAQSVGPLAVSPWAFCRDELFDSTSYWSDPSLLPLYEEKDDGKTFTLLLLERQDKEQDWLIPAQSSSSVSTKRKRCVFFSVKGGVGRSSALTMLAIRLAQQGKRVLVVDGDFESPGVSSSLLPVGDGQPTYGVVDWLTAEALGADPSLLERMALEDVVAPSPLNARLSLAGEVLVAPSYGNRTQTYVSKLARIYRQSQDGKAYAFRLSDFLLAVEEQHKIDVTLFDCRAGIDDTAAVALTQLHADVSFLFAVNTSQTWDSYRLLFKHLRRNPGLFIQHGLAAGENEDPWELRRSFRLVSALTPQEAGSHLGYFENLQQNAYDAFTEIYDEDSGDDPDAYAPAPGDVDAPHGALRVQWVDALRAFNPLKEPSQLTDSINQAAFADFLDRATTLLEMTNGN